MKTGDTFVEIETNIGIVRANRNMGILATTANVVILGSMIGMSFDAPQNTMLMLSALNMVGVGALGYNIKETIANQKELIKLRKKQSQFFQSLKNRR